MTHPLISLTRLPYDDSAWHIELCASNGLFMGTQEFYAHKEDLVAFGKQLERFPVNIKDEAMFKQGGLPKNWFYFLLIRAFLFDSLGHAAIETSTSNNSVSPYVAQVRFFIRTEVAAINTLGQLIQEWTADTGTPLMWVPVFL